MKPVEARRPVVALDEEWLNSPGYAYDMENRFQEFEDMLPGMWQDEAGYLVFGASRTDDAPEFVDVVFTVGEWDEIIRYWGDK